MKHLIALLSLALLLTGCDVGAPASRQMDNYLTRLGRVLEQPVSHFDSRHLSHYRMPERRERVQTVAEQRLSLLDLVVESRHCHALQQRISERNSSLGRLMPASHRLAHEGQLLQALDECLLVIADDPRRSELKTQLEDIGAAKRASLPAVFWNALNASSEFEYYLRFADQPLPPDPSISDTLALQALAELSSIGQALPEQLPPSREVLDPLFQALQRSSRSGQLIHSLARLNHTLNQASTMLESPRAARLCPLGQPTPQSRILFNVFVTYYAGEIQPLLAQAQRLGQPWQQQLTHLREVPEIPPATAAYLQRLSGHEQALWESFQASVQRHNQAWLQVLERCQLQPGQPGWEAARNE